MLKINKKFIVLTIITFVFAYMQGGNLPYSIFYGFIMVFIFALINIVRQKASLDVDVRFQNEIHTVGDSEEITMTAVAKSIIPASYIIIVNNTLQRFYKNYLGDVYENKWIINKIKFEQRGIYDFGDITVTISDLFCVFTIDFHIKKPYIVKVYPKLYKINPISFQSNSIFQMHISNKSITEDSSNLKDVRKYVAGDSLKRVHWKISAKLGEMYVREFNTIAGEESSIFLNMSKDNYFLEQGEAKEEKLIEGCLSLCEYIQTKGIKNNVFISNKENETIHIGNRGDINELIEYFVSHKSQGENDFYQYINSNINKINKHSFIGIVTSEIDNRAKNNAIVISRLGYKVTLFYLSCNINKSDYLNLIGTKGIEIINLDEILKD